MSDIHTHIHTPVKNMKNAIHHWWTSVPSLSLASKVNEEQISNALKYLVWLFISPGAIPDCPRFEVVRIAWTFFFWKRNDHKKLICCSALMRFYAVQLSAGERQVTYLNRISPSNSHIFVEVDNVFFSTFQNEPGSRFGTTKRRLNYPIIMSKAVYRSLLLKMTSSTGLILGV